MSSGGSGFLEKTKRALAVVAGAFLYALGINMFVVPAGLYSGGIMGFCQVLRTLLSGYLEPVLGSFDFAGVLYYLINVPLMIIAWIVLDRRFVLRTVMCVTLMSLFLSFIPAYNLLGTDVITGCLVGGVISGIGTGITLWAGCCGGGMDVVGMMALRRGSNVSVGRTNLLVNVALYLCCLLLFDAKTSIYSIVYAVVYSAALDRMHYQNIDEEIIIITKKPSEEVSREIMDEMGRGVTRLNAHGEFTGERENVLYIIISKYETQKLLSIVRKHDPAAFITVKEHTSVYGNYLKKL